MSIRGLNIDSLYPPCAESLSWARFTFPLHGPFFPMPGLYIYLLTFYQKLLLSCIIYGRFNPHHRVQTKYSLHGSDVILISLLQIDIDNTDIQFKSSFFSLFFLELIMSTTIHCRVLHGNASSRFFLPSMHSTIWPISLSKLWSQMPDLTTLCTQKNDAFYYCL